MDSLIAKTLDFVASPVFVLEPDSSGFPVYAAMNTRALKALGKNLDDILGLTAQQMYPGRLGEAAFDHHCQVMRYGQSRVYEILLPLQGVQKLIRTTLTPELDEHGNVLRIYGSSVDISGAQVVQEIQTEMQTITSEMESFVNLAAHDLRTPMRQVQMVAEMLLDDFEDLGDGKLELINLLAELGEKAMRLIGDVLSHAQATNSVQQVLEFSFGDLVTEIMTMLDPMKTCTVLVEDAMIYGDRTATQIILRNLVDNALKYAVPREDDPTRRLHLWINVTSAGEDGFRVSVKDNGNGFSDPALVFLDSGKLRCDSGFGLLGVRRLVHARGGSLSVTNRFDDHGAEITFCLPGALRSGDADAPLAKRA